MSSKKSNPFIFAFIMCITVSLLLSLTANGLKDRQQLNAKIDKQKNILKALKLLDTNKKYKNNDIIAIYNKKVKNKFINTNNGMITLLENEESIPIYTMEKNSDLVKYAIPFKAYGLWSWIHGIIAIKGDGKTVVGLTVFQHGETPGLGGEVEKAWFQNQFVNKKIVDNNNKFTSIQIAKGKAKDSYKKNEMSYSIDGMSGATITSKGLEKDLKRTLKKYEILSKKLRES